MNTSTQNLNEAFGQLLDKEMYDRIVSGRLENARVDTSKLRMVERLISERVRIKREFLFDSKKLPEGKIYLAQVFGSPSAEVRT